MKHTSTHNTVPLLTEAAILDEGVRQAHTHHLVPQHLPCYQPDRCGARNSSKRRSCRCFIVFSIVLSLLLSLTFPLSTLILSREMPRPRCDPAEADADIFEMTILLRKQPEYIVRTIIALEMRIVRLALLSEDEKYRKTC